MSTMWRSAANTLAALVGLFSIFVVAGPAARADDRDLAQALRAGDLVIVVRGGHLGLSTGIVNPRAIFSGSLGIGLLFALISFVGFEATAIFRDEARDPARTIPRATYVALLLIGGFYALSSWAMVSGFPAVSATMTCSNA